MRNGSKLVRALAALGLATACALALDAAVVLADGPFKPSTRPAVVSPSTQPALVGGMISNNFARPVVATPSRPKLMPAQNGTSAANPADSVIVGGGTDTGEPAAAPPAANSGTTPTSRPATIAPQ